jgi:hypothetical protein
VLTFAISAGDAFEAPSWRAILPELVIKMIWRVQSALGELNSTWHVLAQNSG